VLDVGCGPRQHHLRLRGAGCPGTVIGLDRSPDIIAQATALATSSGSVDEREFQTGNIYDLDFEDGSFDVVHAHQVLQHLTDPVEALREMRRVAKPGGIVAVRDADFHGMSWYPAIPELDEWMELYQKIARRNGAEPDAGRRLVSWAQSAGFTDVAPTSSNWLYATAQQRALAVARLERASAALSVRRAGAGVRLRQSRRTWPGSPPAGTAGEPPTTASSSSPTARSSPGLRPPKAGSKIST
jgi:SAM-dependent methyltransferase